MISPTQAEQLRILTHTEGWTNVLQPWLVAEHDALVSYVLDPSIPRAQGYDKLSDDDIRGEIRRIKRIIGWIANQLQAAAHNQRLDELDGVRGEPAREGSPIS